MKIYRDSISSYRPNSIDPNHDYNEPPSKVSSINSLITKGFQRCLPVVVPRFDTNPKTLQRNIQIKLFFTNTAGNPSKCTSRKHEIKGFFNKRIQIQLNKTFDTVTLKPIITALNANSFVPKKLINQPHNFHKVVARRPRIIDLASIRLRSSPLKIRNYISQRPKRRLVKVQVKSMNVIKTDSVVTSPFSICVKNKYGRLL